MFQKSFKLADNSLSMKLNVSAQINPENLEEKRISIRTNKANGN